jgi:hypothetical protein
MITSDLKEINHNSLTCQGLSTLSRPSTLDPLIVNKACSDLRYLRYLSPYISALHTAAHLQSSKFNLHLARIIREAKADLTSKSLKALSVSPASLHYQSPLPRTRKLLLSATYSGTCLSCYQMYWHCNITKPGFHHECSGCK